MLTPDRPSAEAPPASLEGPNLAFSSSRLARIVAGFALAATAFTAIPDSAIAAPCKPGENGINCNAEGENEGDPGNEGNDGDGNDNGGDLPDIPNNGDGQFEVDPDPDPLPVAAAPDVIANELDEQGFPALKIVTAPEGKTFVRVKTSFWLEQGKGKEMQTLYKLQAKVTPEEDGVQLQVVNAEVKLARIVFKFKDGENQTKICPGPEIKFQGEGAGNPCDYYFKYSSAHEGLDAHKVEATTYWTVEWTCQGACGGAEAGDFEVADLPSVEEDIPVDEIQTEAN